MLLGENAENKRVKRPNELYIIRMRPNVGFNGIRLVAPISSSGGAHRRALLISVTLTQAVDQAIATLFLTTAESTRARLKMKNKR